MLQGTLCFTACSARYQTAMAYMYGRTQNSTSHNQRNALWDSARYLGSHPFLVLKHALAYSVRSHPTLLFGSKRLCIVPTCATRPCVMRSITCTHSTSEMNRRPSAPLLAVCGLLLLDALDEWGPDRRRSQAWGHSSTWHASTTSSTGSGNTIGTRAV